MADRTLRARFEADTGDFSARIAAAQAQLERMERAPVAAARGMMVLRSGLQGLAFEAVGVTGPVGRLASGLGILTLGSPWALGIMAGVGAVALALRAMGHDADEAAKKAAAAAAESAKRVAAAAAATPRAQAIRAMQDVEASNARVAKINQEIAELQQRQAAIQNAVLPGVVRERAENEAKINQLLAKRTEELVGQNALLAQQAGTLEEIVIASAPLFRLPSFAGIQAPRIAPPAIPGIPTAPFPSSEIGVEQRPMEFFIQRAFGDTGAKKALDEAIEAERTRLNLIDHLNDVITQEAAGSERAVIAHQLLAEATKKSADATELAALKTKQAAASLIMGAGTLIQSLINGGGNAGTFVGGGLGIVGGIVGASNPILGAGLMAGGGILSAIFGRHKQETIPVRDDASRAEIARLRAELAARQDRLISLTIGPETFVGSWEEIQYELNRSGRRRGEPRLPGA